VPSEPSYNHCNRCGGETFHSIAGECRNCSEAHLEDGSEISFSERSELLECQVCKQTRLRVSFWNSENDDGPVFFYPPLSKHRAPAWLKELPVEYKDLAEQIYPALDAGSYSLALMGARALLDLYISRHSSVSNDFNKKLENLLQLGALSAKQIEILSRTFDAGSAAAHRGYLPSEANVITALQVVESLLQQDVLGVKTQQLQADTPARKR